MTIFSSSARTDGSPRRANETMFNFLDRTGLLYFEPVRDLLEAWVSDVPAEARGGIVGNLSSGDDKFYSALWELYLYKVASGSADHVEFHPDVTGTSRHPDFLVHGATSYYLEAVAVGRRPERVATERRLRDVEAVLDRVRVTGVTLNFEHHQVGSKPIRAAKLRDQLLRWIDRLNADDLALQRDEFRPGAHRPTYEFEDEGWYLAFEALPTARGTSRKSPLIGIRGDGRAKGVDNKTGLRRVLDAKSSRYGTSLPYPLVTAIFSNTDFPTRNYDISEALYGLSALPPASVTDHIDLNADGHWRTKTGWRRSHNPNVIVAAGLTLHNLTSVTPTLWTTLEPSARAVADIEWADPVDVSTHDLRTLGRLPALGSLGIDASWCSGVPDFDT
ncbi:hypothetical protein [Pseudoclavibacter sp. CFCC 11306]|uniref:hypothetical protein n=1 Tax=Pseudoclavibacter sp. CFCC 11306 TaxID=1564493 RepID=UPI00130143F4|nr:hypothetical protein [Pseudoclavibacter sp. CFCC 11306]KAB1658164.1 hypothetical protein F8O09_00575 [Pseudoclavibacter sp. CFCC 11306]